MDGSLGKGGKLSVKLTCKGSGSFLEVPTKVTVQDLVGKGQAPHHQSLGYSGGTSHLFWKRFADVGKPLRCSHRVFCRDFL